MSNIVNILILIVFSTFAINLIGQHNSHEIEKSMRLTYYKRNVLDFDNKTSRTDRVPRLEQGIIRIDRLGNKVTMTIESNRGNNLIGTYVGYIDESGSSDMTFYCQMGENMVKVNCRFDAFIKITTLKQPKRIVFFYIKPIA